MADIIEGSMGFHELTGGVEFYVSSGGRAQDQGEHPVDQWDLMHRFRTQAYTMLVNNGGRGMDLPTLAFALATDEATAENVLDGFGRNMMQQGEGRDAEFLHWDALPRLEKLAYYLGKSPWSVKTLENN